MILFTAEGERPFKIKMGHVDYGGKIKFIDDVLGIFWGTPHLAKGDRIILEIQPDSSSDYYNYCKY